MGGQEKTCNASTADYQLSRWRAVCTLIHSWEFKDLFAHYGDEQTQKLIDEGNIDQLRVWVKTAKHGPLAEKPVEELRLIASKYSIKYYGKLSKRQLLIAITRSMQNATTA